MRPADLPGELHKLWRTSDPKGYHLEYGFSCMGYEIAGGLGVKMAFPDRRVFVLVGDGSYLMMNSELATSVMMGLKLDVVLLDNRGFGCINRLQQSVGDPAFNNLLPETSPDIDFAGHARSLGADRRKGRQHRRAGKGARAREQNRRAATSSSSRPTPPSRPGGRRLVGRAGGRDREARAMCARRAPPTSRPPPPRRTIAIPFTFNPTSPFEDPTMTVKLGINPIGWTNDCLHWLGDFIPLDQCLAEARQAGFSGVELGRKFPRHGRQARADS